MQNLLHVVVLGIKGLPPSQFSCNFCLALAPLYRFPLSPVHRFPLSPVHRFPRVGRCWVTVAVSVLAVYENCLDEGLIFADLAGIQFPE